MPENPTQIAAANIRRLRKERKWSALMLAEEITRLGGNVSRGVLANLENGRVAELGINALAVIAAALRVEPWALTEPGPLICTDCGGSPPLGFRCMTCSLDSPRTPVVSTADRSERGDA